MRFMENIHLPNKNCIITYLSMIDENEFKCNCLQTFEHALYEKFGHE